MGAFYLIMSKSPPAIVEPPLLVWARQSARLSEEEAAARMKLPEARIRAWEAGEERPSVAQLRKIANIYRRPVGVFFLPAVPHDFQVMHDFRRIGSEAPALSAELEGDLRHAQDLRDAALTLLENEGEGAFPISAALSDDPEEIGALLRLALHVTDADQLGWKDSYQALREWRSAVEELGVLVVNMRGVDVSDARGFSIAQFPLPLVALNTKDAPNGRVFTLLHEVAHLALHDGGICDWTPTRKLAPADRRVESFCNQVAAATLLPRALVQHVVSMDAIPSSSDWDDDRLKRFARSLCTSEEALLRRLVDMGLASESLYAMKRAEYLKRYAEAAKSASKPIVSFEKRVVGRLGTAYLDLAFGAYYAHRLTLSELSSYTGVRVAHLARIEREAFGMSRVPGATA